MVALRKPADSQPAICPACGASVKMPGRGKKQRMQCPRCREGVIFEKPEATSEGGVDIADVTLAERAQQQARIAALEARIVALENTVFAASPANHEPASFAQPTRIQVDRPADFSPEQAEILRKNLSAIRAHAITILFPQGDDAARARAEWFKEVFERAQWDVHCPEHAQPAHAARILTFASRVPAAPEVAATYFAIRGAGFDLATENDPDLKETEQRLTVA